MPQGDLEDNTPGSIDVDDVIAIMTDQLASIAWQKLGLQPDVVSGTLGTDLAQARRAIDAVVALTGIVEPALDDEDRRRTKNLVNDLRANFLARSEEPHP